MKLHLPKALFAAVLAACAVLGQQAYAADTVWVNFGTSAVPSDTPASEGLGAPGVWNNITGGDAAAVNGTHNLTDEQGVQKALLLLSAAQNPWGPSSAAKTDVLTNMKSSYLDLNANNQWTISLVSDYMFSDLSLYLSGDGNQFSPVAVNGSNYIGGTNVAAGTTTGWGTREVGTSISDANTVIVTGIHGAISASNVSVGDTAKRATLAGLSLTNTTGAHSWNATMTENAAASSMVWEKGASAAGDAWNSAASTLNVTAAEGGSSLAIDGASSLNAIVANGDLTVTSNDAVTVGTLWATAGSSLTFNATLTTGSDLTSGGFGTVTIGADQTLGNVTIASGSTFHVADGVSIVANGNVANNGTITGGDGASFFANLSAGTALSVGGVSVTANKDAKADMLGGAGANLMVTDGTSVDINSTGTGAVKILKQGEGNVNVTIGTLSLANGSVTTINADEGVSLSHTTGDLSLDAGQTLTVGEGVTITANGVSHLGNVALNIDGGTFSTNSMLAQDLGWNRKTVINITDGLFEVKNTDANRGGYKTGSIRLAHWPGSNSTLNVLGGEFRALGADIGMGDDGNATVNISGTGVVNARGIYTKGGSSVNLSDGGTLNLGANGLFGGTGNLVISGTGATLGALADWHVENNAGINMTDASLTVNTGDAKTIDLSGANLTTSDTSISLAGSGTLLIGSAINGVVNLAAGSTATLALSDSFALSDGKIMLGGQESANGYLYDAYHVMNLGTGQTTNISTVTVGEDTLTLDTNTGKVYRDHYTGAFAVGSTYTTSEFATLSEKEVDHIQVNDGATLKVDTATLDKNVVVKGSGTIDIAEGSVVNKSQVSLQDGATLALTGAGNYVLNGTTAAAATVGEGWTGVVTLQSVTFADTNLANYAHEGSVVELNGVSGYLLNYAGGSCDQNLKLTDNGETKALVINNGSSTTAFTFKGALTGEGTFATIGTNDPSLGGDFVFTGDLTAFKGNFERKTARFVDGNTDYSSKYEGILQFGANAAAAYAGTAQAEEGVIHNIAGSGVIETSGVLRFNYAKDEAGNKLALDNSSITARYIEFNRDGGDASYVVNAALVGQNETAANNTLKVSGGEVTVNGTMSNIGNVVVGSATLGFSAQAVTIDSLTLNAGSVIEVSNHSGSLTTSALTVGGDATINADLIIANQGSLNMSGTITMGCELTLGAGLTLGGDVLTSVNGFTQDGDSITLFTGVDRLTLVGDSAFTTGSVQASTVFANIGDGPMNKYLLNYDGDAVTLSLNVVPEPATATLSLLALAGLAARRRRH